MSRAACNLACAVLVAFAIWPAIQLGLVAVYDVNPWKLAGWGMYSAPQLPAKVQVLCRAPDAVGVYELGSIRPELEPEFRRFLRMRRSLRRLVRPDRFARAVLDHYAAIEGVDVVVVQPVMNRHTGMIEERSTVYSYDR